MKKLFLSFLIVLFWTIPSFAAFDFFDGFEDGTIGNWGEQSCCADSVVVQSSIVETGNYAVKIFIDTDDYVSGSRRVELVYENPPGSFYWIGKNKEYWYVADYYFPADFPTETPRNYVMWQLHCGFGSPTLSLRSSEDNIGFDGKGTHTNLRISNVWGSTSSPDEDKYDLGLMTDYLGRWNHIVVHFYLSSNSDGYIEAWVNDVKKLDLHDIPTHPNVTGGAYLKCGLYSAAAGSTPVTIYIDNIRYIEGSFGIPEVSSQSVTDITSTTATGHGTITTVGDANCTKRGICWNTTGGPTVADNKVEEDGNFGVGAFSGNMTNLTPGQHYFKKPYALNTAGYGYGDQVEFDADAVSGTYIIDDGDNGTSSTGNWYSSGGLNPYGVGSIYSHEVNATYTYEKTLDGNYTVSLWWTEYASRSAAVTVKIYDSGDNLLDTKSVNQTTNGGQWNSQGTYDFNATAKVTILSTGGAGPVSTCADAVKFDYVEGSGGESVNNPSVLPGIHLHGCTLN